MKPIEFSKEERAAAGRPVESTIVENHTWEVEADTVETVETVRRRRLTPW